MQSVLTDGTLSSVPLLQKIATQLRWILQARAYLRKWVHYPEAKVVSSESLRSWADRHRMEEVGLKPSSNTGEVGLKSSNLFGSAPSPPKNGRRVNPERIDELRSVKTDCTSVSETLFDAEAWAIPTGKAEAARFSGGFGQVWLPFCWICSTC